MQKFIILFLLILFLLPLTTHAAIMDTVRGMILLQVETNGEAWYVNPADSIRYYMKDGPAAYQIMRKLSLGIINADLEKIPLVSDTATMLSSASVCKTNILANRLKGKILLQVQANGEAWYIYPKTCRRIYLKDGETAYTVMRYLGLGITDLNLALIPRAPEVSEKFLSCLETKKYNDLIQADIATAKTMDVSGTPTSFLNGVRHEGYMLASVWDAILTAYSEENPGEAPVIATFSDFQCPYCSRQAAVFDQLLTKYDNLTIEFHHFPLSFHDQALNAALASECAREQGKFKEMHDALFDLSWDGNLTYDNILLKAGDLGL